MSGCSGCPSPCGGVFLRYTSPKIREAEGEREDRYCRPAVTRVVDRCRGIGIGKIVDTG